MFILLAYLSYGTILQTVGDLTSVPETGTNITNQWEPKDVPHTECIFNVLLWPSGHCWDIHT